MNSPSDAAKIFESGSRLSSNVCGTANTSFRSSIWRSTRRTSTARAAWPTSSSDRAGPTSSGSGYIYPPTNVKQALRSVWKYDWAPDVGPHNGPIRRSDGSPCPGEAGLFTCTWPKSAYLKEGVRYREEVWTGIEYQVAGHMVWEDMVTEALAICRGVEDRYHPAKHNPFNEIECGDHYARAMASWGVYTALAGFEYHGPKGHIGFAPAHHAGEFPGRVHRRRRMGLIRPNPDRKTRSESRSACAGAV